MQVHDIVERVQTLSDLELAALVCLIAKQHCSIEVEDDLVDDLAQELALIVSEIFGLSYAVLSEDDQSNVDVFGDAILDRDSSRDANDQVKRDDSHDRLGHDFAHRYQLGEPGLDDRKIVNVIIVKSFNWAPEEVQIQAMELVRRRRIFSRTTIHGAPDDFMILSILPSSLKDKRYRKHLNDRIFISHRHEPEDGFPNLEDMGEGYLSDDQGSDSSDAYRSEAKLEGGSVRSRAIDSGMIDQLRALGQTATISPEIRTYMQNIVVFLRIERGVAGGVTPYATVLFEALAKYLAPLHGLDYVTPSLVALAARKIYAHRIQIALPQNERSMQYGSDLDAVQDLLNDITPGSVIEAVLNSVECPL